ncbi:MAG: diguanylate cyclase, partial [Gammaproteobacteria bacterium]|nr:diguanylate cyclase [Gammaproteobacteria bacterium]
MFLRRFSPSKFIISAILVLALLLLLFIGHSGWQAWQERNAAGHHVLGSRIGTLAVRLATSRAMERALSMAHLSLGQRAERDLQHKLREVRLAGDEVRENLIKAVQEWLHKKPDDFVLEVELAQEKKHHLALRRLRGRLDQTPNERLQPLEPVEVFDIFTRAIGHAEHLNMTAKALTVGKAGAKGNQWAISEWASHVSEQAGQVRGLLTYYIGAREPIPPQVRYQIHSSRYEVEHHIELLHEVEPRLEDATELRQRIRELDKVLPAEFVQMYQMILAAAESGDYPVDQESWLAVANRAVAGMAAVATAGANSMETTATAQQRAATWALAWLLFLGVLAMGLAGLAFYRVRDTARTLERQRNRAEQAVGELSREIAARQQLEKRLRRYRTIISTSPDHFALIDPDYTYSIVNETYLRAHDLLPGQIVGKPVAELLGEEVFQAQVRQNLDRCLTDETVNYEGWFDFPGSGRRFMHVTYFPFHDQAGAVAGVVVSSQDVTELKHAGEALHQREEQLRTITNALPGLVMQVDRDYRSRFVNQTAAEWFGAPIASILGSHLRELVGEERFTAIRPYYEQAFAGEQTTFETEFPCADGITRWLQLTLVPANEQGGDGQDIYVLGNDITYRKKMESKLQASQAGFRSLVEQNLTGIIVVDREWGSLFCNAAGRTMLGESSGSDQGRCNSLDMLREGDAELDIRRLDGSLGVAQVLVTETVWQGTPAQLVMLYDITERKQAEREVAHMAYHDLLTGLPNRVMFHDRIEHALARVRRSNTKLALLYLDLDRFKMINDSLGHASGDELLRQMAQRLRKSVREMDTVARLSGDEFMVLLEDLEQCEQAQNVAEKIRLALGSPYQVHNQQLVVNSSIGISVFPDDG